MARYRLHYFPESGNSYKLALMLKLCGETFEPIWTDFASGVTRSAEWRRTVNPMGEIPVLEDDGENLTQTAPILLRLAERCGHFGGSHEGERFEILRWLFWDNQKLSGFMATYRYLRAFTPSPNPAVLAFLKWRVDDFLDILDERLREQAFVVDHEVTIADISMCGYLLFPGHESGYELFKSYPAVGRWLRRLMALPGWQPPYDLLPGKRLTCHAPES